jgi:hypothetical protein
MRETSNDARRLLQSEPNGPRLAAMRKFNATTQSISVDLLQTIVARGEIEQAALETVESVIVRKLYMCVHTGRLDLQNKLLHLLHSVISALTTLGSQLPMTHQPRLELLSETAQAQDVDREVTPQSYNMNPLLTQTLIDGIGTLSNRPLLQHWLDFVLMTIPQFHLVLQPAVEPLIECICRQLRSATNDTASARAQVSDTQDIFSATSDAEFIMLLHAIERLLLLNLSSQVEAADAEDDGNYAEKPVTDGTGLFGYVSNVFGSENPANVPEEQLAVSRYEDEVYERLIRRCNRPVRRHIVHSTGAYLCCIRHGSLSSGEPRNPGRPRTTRCHISITEPGRDAGASLNICSVSAPLKFWNPSSTAGAGNLRCALLVRALRPQLTIHCLEIRIRFDERVRACRRPDFQRSSCGSHALREHIPAVVDYTRQAQETNIQHHAVINHHIFLTLRRSRSEAGPMRFCSGFWKNTSASWRALWLTRSGTDLCSLSKKS